jgi:hypothetical protein
MPGTQLTDTPVQPDIHAASPFKNVSYRPLHPTFGAEVTGFDFETVDEAKVAEIKRALAVVSTAMDACLRPHSRADLSTACLCFARLAWMMPVTSP